MTKSLVQLALTTRFRAPDPSLNFTNNQYEVRVCPKKPNEKIEIVFLRLPSNTYCRNELDTF